MKEEQRQLRGAVELHHRHLRPEQWPQGPQPGAEALRELPYVPRMEMRNREPQPQVRRETSGRDEWPRRQADAMSFRHALRLRRSRCTRRQNRPALVVAMTFRKCGAVRQPARSRSAGSPSRPHTNRELLVEARVAVVESGAGWVSSVIFVLIAICRSRFLICYQRSLHRDDTGGAARTDAHRSCHTDMHIFDRHRGRDGGASRKRK